MEPAGGHFGYSHATFYQLQLSCLLFQVRSLSIMVMISDFFIFHLFSWKEQKASFSHSTSWLSAKAFRLLILACTRICRNYSCVLQIYVLLCVITNVWIILKKQNLPEYLHISLFVIDSQCVVCPVANSRYSWKDLSLKLLIWYLYAPISRSSFCISKYFGLFSLLIILWRLLL